MTLGKKLTLNLSLIIVAVLLGYGYFHIQSRREVLTRLMQAEAKSIGEILRVSLEKISFPQEMAFVQEILDAVSEPQRTLGAVFFDGERHLVFRSQSIEGDVQSFLQTIQTAVEENRPQEVYGQHRDKPVFCYAFPIRDKKGNPLGGISIVQLTSFMEGEIRHAQWTIFIIILLLVGGTLILVLTMTRRWIIQPISQLMSAIQKMAQGHLGTHVQLHRSDEISALGQAFNQMASDLKKAQERILQEAEAKMQLERSLRQSEKLATIGQLASELAHEIGTPLNIISGRAELSRRKIDDPAILQRNLDTIVQQTEKITKIIQQLLGFVRKKKPDPVNLPMAPLLETVLEFLEPSIEKQRIQIGKDFAPSPCNVKGDPDQLQQVFLNILLNAIQAMPNGGTLRISIHPREISRRGVGDRPAPYVEIAVADTGKGIPPEVLQHIFDPFFTTKEKGTGLGLTISHGIVQEHDGWIDIESETDKGSTFRVFLPRADGMDRHPDRDPPMEWQKENLR